MHYVYINRHRESDSTEKANGTGLSYNFSTCNEIHVHRFPLSQACPFNPATIVTKNYEILNKENLIRLHFNPVTIPTYKSTIDQNIEIIKKRYKYSSSA